MSEPSPNRPLPRPRPARPSRLPRVLAVAAIGALAAVGLTACGPGRSVEAYCGVMAKHKDRFVTATQDVGSADPITGLTTLVAAYGDLNGMWEDAAKVAPEEIQTDVETVRDAWATQKETAETMLENPLKGLASGLMTGLTSAAATQRVDEYTAAQCPDVGGMFLAGGSTAPTADGSTGGTDWTDGTGGTDGADASAEPPQDPTPSPDTAWYAFGPVWAESVPDDLALRGPSVFFVPEVGEVQVSGSDLLGGSEVVDEQYLFFPEGDEPRVAGLITERIPSSGLEPEGYATSVVTVELGSGLAEVSDRIDRERVPEQPAPTLAGTAGEGIVVVEEPNPDSVAEYWEEGTDTTNLVAFDLTTGEQAWSRPSTNLQRQGALGFGWTTEPVWNHDGDCTDRPYTEDGTVRPVTYEWTDLGTGTAAFTMPLMVDGEDGVVCRNIREALSPRFSLVERWNSDLYETEGMYVLDHRSQQTFPVPGPITAADPVGTAGYTYEEFYAGSGVVNDLVVVDLSSGEELYRLDAERTSALDLSVKALFDGILYLTTTDENVAVDIATGEELGPWSVSPESRVGANTLLSDGTLERDWSFTAG